MNVTLSFALSLHKASPLAFTASALFLHFPRLVLRLLLDRCQGRLAAATLLGRCMMLLTGDVAGLIHDAHEAKIERVKSRTTAASA